MKKILVAVMAAAMIFCTVGCGNYNLIDTTYTFDRAIVSLPNGELIEGKVQSWNDYEGDQIQVKINDVTYLVHSINIALIAE